MKEWSEVMYMYDDQLTGEFLSILEHEAERYAEYTAKDQDVFASLCDRDTEFINKINQMQKSLEEYTPPPPKQRKRRRNMTPKLQLEYSKMFAKLNKPAESDSAFPDKKQ